MVDEYPETPWTTPDLWKVHGANAAEEAGLVCMVALASWQASDVTLPAMVAGFVIALVIFGAIAVRHRVLRRVAPPAYRYAVKSDYWYRMTGWMLILSALAAATLIFQYWDASVLAVALIVAGAIGTGLRVFYLEAVAAYPVPTIPRDSRHVR